MRGLVILLFLLLSAALDAAPAVYVVRHAEKLEGSDPALSTRGAARAAALAELLAESGIVRIFSTDTQRTRQTAAALAERLGLSTEIYDHRTQAQLAADLKARRETVLVVGHSNTIGDFVAALGANPGTPVGEDEYDRLYVIALNGESVRGELRRYGESLPAADASDDAPDQNRAPRRVD